MNFDPSEHDWVTDDMPSLRRDFLPAELESLMANADVQGCIAVEARQLPIETTWLCALAQSHPTIVAVVGWVDLTATDLGNQLDGLVDPIIAGFRHVVIDEPDDFLDRPAVRSGIRELGRRGFLYEFLVLPRQLSQATEIALDLPDQQFVLDHAGLPNIKGGEYARWRAGLASLARCPNVSVKLSGLEFGARSHEWTDADLVPYLDTAVELFGPGRLMMGSNWPVCTLSSTYDRSVGAITDYVAALSADEQADMLGRTAAALYCR